jgi:Trm5-related predicted tRNA methylase
MESIFELDIVEVEEVSAEDEEAYRLREESNELARIEGLKKYLEVRAERFARKVKVSTPEAVQKNSWWWSLTEEEKVAYRTAKKQEVLDGKERLKAAMLNGINLCIDLSWDVEHSVRERQSLYKQLSLTYGCLKRAAKPMHLHITSVLPGSETENGLIVQGVQQWFASMHEESPWQLFDPSSIIVLSPDSEHVLESVDNDKVWRPLMLHLAFA